MPQVKQFIERLETKKNDKNSFELLQQDFSDTKLNPHTLTELLEKLGYEVEDRNDNGWQLDFWITMTKESCKPIVIQGTGILFEVMLSEREE